MDIKSGFKQFWREYWSFISPLKNTIFISLVGFLFTLQIFNLVSFVGRNVDLQGVIATYDDDASWGIHKTLKTRWWNDNHWFLYGPLFFRLAHTGQYFLGDAGVYLGRDLDQDERHQVSAHFSLLILSVLSLAGLALLLACLLTTDWGVRLCLAILLLAALCFETTRAEFLFRAHPDHMVALLMVVALYFLGRWLEQGQTRDLYFSGVVWGLSALVKFFIAAFLPAFLLLFLLPLSKKRVQAGLYFAGAMFLTYLILGFPQSFTFARAVNMILKVSKINVAADSESLGQWITLLREQFWAPAIVLVFGALMTRSTAASRCWSRRTWVYMLMILVVVMSSLLTRKSLVPWNHYAIPIVAVGWLYLTLASRHLGSWFRLSLRSQRVFAGLAVLVLFFFGGVSTPQLRAELGRQMQCREQAHTVYERIRANALQGRRIWVDPYVPIYNAARDKQLFVEWTKTWDKFDSIKPDFVYLSQKFKSRYEPREPMLYVQKENLQWQETQAFYDAFLGRRDEASAQLDPNMVMHPKGRVRLIKTFEQNCVGVEEWTAEPTP